jgi:hypothetical protein
MRCFVGALTLAALLLAAAGCSNRAVAGGGERTTIDQTQYIIVIDLSASRNDLMLAESRKFLSLLVQNLTFGDQVAILGMQQVGLVDHPLRWQTSMPEVRDPSFPTFREKASLQAAKKGVDAAVDTFFKDKNAARAMHTDIFTTLLLASEFARDSKGRPTKLILLSDMLQSAKGVEMQGLRRMPNPGWIEREKRIGLIPVLPGTCVLAVGADPTTREGITIRGFWEAYFAAAGASLKSRDYRATPPTDISDVCRSS